MLLLMQLPPGSTLGLNMPAAIAAAARSCGLQGTRPVAAAVGRPAVLLLPPPASAPLPAAAALLRLVGAQGLQGADKDDGTFMLLLLSGPAPAA
jgi:hypothetical protein